MTFSLNDIQTGIKPMPRKIVIYGPPKMGKSTLAGATKDSLMIPFEDRVSHVDCAKTPLVTNYRELLEIFTFLLNQEHPYKRIIIDTIDWMEPLLHKYICEEKGFTSLTDEKSKDTNFSRGLKYHAVEGWKTFLNNCDLLRSIKGMDIILLGHDQQVKISPPDKDAYDKYVMKIDKYSLNVIEEWADIIAFYDKQFFIEKEDVGFNKTQGKALVSDKRVLHISGRHPAMLNANSFGLPDVETSLEGCTKIMEWLLTANNNKPKQAPVEEPPKKTKGDK